MKTLILAIVLALGAMTIFTACEKNDYQHPLHRSR